MKSFDKEQLLHEFQQYLSKIEEMFLQHTEELQASENRFKTVVEQAGDAIVIINEKLKIVSWNEGAQYVFGYRDYEAIGRPIDELITNDSVLDESIQFSQKVLRGEKIRSVEAIRFAKGNIPKNVIITATPMKNKNGLVNSICLIYKDITELKKAQENLLQSEKQATLGIIAGSIGHELNNIIGGMLLYSQLIRENPGEAESVKKYSEILCEYLTTISMHAKNLLSLSKPVKPEIKEVNIIELLEATTETLILSGVLKNFQIEKQFNPNLPAIKGDINLLEQVIRNLEINSAHAMQPGGKLTIGAQLTENYQYVEFFIQDTGSGIPKKIRPKIFDMFFTTKAEGKGTGLGLPIVKQIIEQHQGYLKIESQLNVGTKFIVGIPVAK
ncbi:PAS domain S-box protein [candidate division KSB1 bacterium]|nr:PAS domain S-box protein [candidate division KSB1 bacterium]